MPEFLTADLIDEFGDLCSSCSAQFRSFGTARFSGSIRTILCYDDNVLLKQLLSTPGEGLVLVVDGAGFLGSALLGDQMAELAITNHWSGVVIHGALRDSVALSRLPIGIKALGTNPRKSGKRGIGVVDVRVEFGGVRFTPGQWLYSDDDGILVSENPLLGEG
jgi:regulator of ribonuclease activity A